MSLSQETQKLIQDRMERYGYPTADDVIKAALNLLDRQEELDAETRDAIDRSEEQIERGEYRDWSAVSVELRKKYVRK